MPLDEIGQAIARNGKTGSEIHNEIMAAVAHATDVIAGGERTQALAQLRALITLCHILTDEYPAGTDAHLASVNALGHVEVVSVTGDDGEVLWASGLGEAPECVRLANQLALVLGHPAVYGERIRRLGLPAFIRPEDRVKRDFRDQYSVELG